MGDCFICPGKDSNPWSAILQFIRWLDEQVRWTEDPVFWLATQVGKMTISCLPRITPCSAITHSLKAIIITNSLLTKLVQSRWLDVALILLFLRLCGPWLCLGPLTLKKELGQYPAILTKQAWLITHENIARSVNHLSARGFDLRLRGGGGEEEKYDALHGSKKRNKRSSSLLTNLPSLIHQDQQSHSENVACPPLLENENFHHAVWSWKKISRIKINTLLLNLQGLGSIL